MKRLVALLGLVTLTLILEQPLWACPVCPDVGTPLRDPTPPSIGGISLGMSPDQVRFVLGRPRRRGTYGGMLDIWYYDSMTVRFWKKGQRGFCLSSITGLRLEQGGYTMVRAGDSKRSVEFALGERDKDSQNWIRAHWTYVPKDADTFDETGVFNVEIGLSSEQSVISCSLREGHIWKGGGPSWYADPLRDGLLDL